MPGLESAYSVVDNIWKTYESAKSAKEAPGTDMIPHALGGGGAALNAGGWLLGGSMPAASTPILGTGAGSAFASLGTGMITLGGLAGAGALGYTMGSAADKAFGISDKIVGTIDDDLWEDQGLVATTERGIEGARKAEHRKAARLAHDEAKRQQELSSLIQSSQSPGMFGGMSRDVLRAKHGIDMDSSEEKTNPAVEHVRREAERQVSLSSAIRMRQSSPMMAPMADAHIQTLLGHYAD